MIEYLIILFLLMVSALIEPSMKSIKSDSARTFFVILSLILLICLCGFRYETGKDYKSYLFLYSQPEELYTMKEVGFIWTIKMFNALSLPFSFFCFVYATFTVALTYRFIIKYSPYICFSILIYYSLGNFYFSSFNVMRQALAVAIFINTFQLIKQHQFIKYFFIITITSIFIHASTIILLPLYFILPYIYKNVFKILITVAILSLSSVFILAIEASPYSVYLKIEDFSTSVPPTYYLLGGFGILTLIYSMVHPEWEKSNPIISNLNIICICLIGLIFIYANTPLVMVVNRILGFFTIIYIVIIPQIIYSLPSKITKNIIYLCFIIVLSFLSYNSLNQNGTKNNMVPYKSILSQ